MSYMLTNNQSRMSFLGEPFYEIITLAERIGSIPFSPSELGNPSIDIHDEQAHKDHKLVPFTVSKNGAAKLSKVLRKVLKIVDDQLSNAPELQHYRKSHGTSNAYIMYWNQINRLLGFLELGAFSIRLLKAGDWLNNELTVTRITLDPAQ